MFATPYLRHLSLQLAACSAATAGIPICTILQPTQQEAAISLFSLPYPPHHATRLHLCKHYTLFELISLEPTMRYIRNTWLASVNPPPIIGRSSSCPSKAARVSFLAGNDKVQKSSSCSSSQSRIPKSFSPIIQLRCSASIIIPCSVASTSIQQKITRQGRCNRNHKQNPPRNPCAKE